MPFHVRYLSREERLVNERSQVTVLPWGEAVRLAMR